MGERGKRFVRALFLTFFALTYADCLWAATTNVILNFTSSKSCNALVEATNEYPARGSHSSGAQSITQELSTDRRSVIGFTALLPVTVVLLDLDRGGTRAYYYPNPGALTDTNLDGGAVIRAVRYCYGSTGPAPVRESLKPCSQLGISCAAGANNVLLSLDPDSPNWGAKLCVCGTATFAECNPTLPAGQEAGCATGRPLPEPPVQMDMIRDGTYLCITLGGFRQCYRR